MSTIEKLSKAVAPYGLTVTKHPFESDAYQFLMNEKIIGSINHIPSLDLFQYVSPDKSNDVGVNTLGLIFNKFSDFEFVSNFINKIQEHHLINALIPKDKRIVIDHKSELNRDGCERIYFHRYLTAVNCWNMFGQEMMYKLNDDGHFSLIRKLSIIIDKHIRSTFYIDYENKSFFTCFNDDFKFSEDLVYQYGVIEDINCILELWLATYSMSIYNYLIELNKHEDLKATNVIAAIQSLQTLEMCNV